jgi:hypothetical protein
LLNRFVILRPIADTVRLFASLKDLKKDLPVEKNDIFERTQKIYLMGHGDDESANPEATHLSQDYLLGPTRLVDQESNLWH